MEEVMKMVMKKMMNMKVVDLDDPWWDKISDDSDLFDVDVNVGASHGDGGAGPSNVEAEICRNEEGNEKGRDDEGNHICVADNLGTQL
jgi:hypothetical protein